MGPSCMGRAPELDDTPLVDPHRNGSAWLPPEPTVESDGARGRRSAPARGDPEGGGRSDTSMQIALTGLARRVLKSSSPRTSSAASSPPLSEGSGVVPASSPQDI